MAYAEGMATDGNNSTLQNLSLPERLALLEAVCESLADDASELPLSVQQRKFIRERLEAYEADKRPGTPAAESVARIRAARK